MTTLDYLNEWLNELIYPTQFPFCNLQNSTAATDLYQLSGGKAHTAQTERWFCLTRQANARQSSI